MLEKLQNFPIGKMTRFLQQVNGKTNEQEGELLQIFKDFEFTKRQA